MTAALQLVFILLCINEMEIYAIELEVIITLMLNIRLDLSSFQEQKYHLEIWGVGVGWNLEALKRENKVISSLVNMRKNSVFRIPSLEPLSGFARKPSLKFRIL